MTTRSQNDLLACPRSARAEQIITPSPNSSWWGIERLMSYSTNNLRGSRAACAVICGDYRFSSPLMSCSVDVGDSKATCSGGSCQKGDGDGKGRLGMSQNPKERRLTETPRKRKVGRGLR